MQLLVCLAGHLEKYLKVQHAMRMHKEPSCLSFQLYCLVEVFSLFRCDSSAYYYFKCSGESPAASGKRRVASVRQLRAASKAFQFNWQLMLLWSSGLPNVAASASRASWPCQAYPSSASIWVSPGGSLVLSGQCLTCPPLPSLAT